MTVTELPWTTLVDVNSLAAVLADPPPGADAIRVIDARFSLADPRAGRALHAAGHLPGAVHADLNEDLSDLSRIGHGRHPLPESEAFSATLGRWGIGPQTQVVVYDAADGSMAAARLWWLLRLLGHRGAAVLDGGFAAWQAQGLPVTDRAAAPSALAPYPGRFDMQQVAGSEEIANRLKHAPGWLVDARAVQRFGGEVEPLDPVAGHVPGAVNRPFALNVQNGRMRPADELRAELQAVIGAHQPTQVVLMCGSGVTACHLALAMEHAGLAGARIYADSWSGWVADRTRPVARSG